MIKMVHVPKEETEHFVYYDRRSSPNPLPIRGRGSEGMDLEEKHHTVHLNLMCFQCIVYSAFFRSRHFYQHPDVKQRRRHL
jgi:hypothetical protein